MILQSQKSDQQRKLLFRNHERVAERSSRNCQKGKLSRTLQSREKNVGHLKRKNTGRKNRSAFNENEIPVKNNPGLVQMITDLLCEDQ